MCFALAITGADDIEYRLMRDLLRNYDRQVRPSLNASEPLNVTFGLALAQIIDVVRAYMFVYMYVCFSVSLCISLSITVAPPALFLCDKLSIGNRLNLA